MYTNGTNVWAQLRKTKNKAKYIKMRERTAIISRPTQWNQQFECRKWLLQDFRHRDGGMKKKKIND